MKKNLPAIFLILVSILFAVYLSEVFLRLYFVLPSPIASYYPFSPAKKGSTVLADQYEYKIPYKFNSYGFREHEFSLFNKNDKKRILFLGDSFVEGFGVEDKERFTDVIQQELGSSYEIINAGQTATNPEHYFDNLTTFGVALKPDTVVMTIFVGNDFMGGSVVNWPKEYTVVKEPKSDWIKKNSLFSYTGLDYVRELFRTFLHKDGKLLKRYVLGNYWDLYFGKKIDKSFYTESLKIEESTLDNFTKDIDRELLNNYYTGRVIPTLLLESVQEKLPNYEETAYRYTPEDYSKTLAIISESKKVAEENNIDFKVLIIPDLYQVHTESFEKVLRDEFKMVKIPSRFNDLEKFREQLVLDLNALDITYLDVTEALKASPEPTYYFYDQHLNKLGHALVGEALLEKLFISEAPIISAYESPISISYLRRMNFDSKEPAIEEKLPSSGNYSRSIASYTSEGNKIYGLLTVPTDTPPEGGFPAIVFVHGYIPPNSYVTTERYDAYVDYLAKNDFVVFKIDLRGHGNSEGSPTGSYFSSAYTIDAINALKSLQHFKDINPQKIGMWGHSMSGNAVLRAMLVTSDIKAGVIWAGAVYSYEDFAKYRINDGSYVPRQPSQQDLESPNRENSEEVRKFRENAKEIDFNNSFWTSISLTKNINYLNAPLQLHHSVNDPTVNIGYSRDLAKTLDENGKKYELYEYQGGGHDIESPYFEQAMQRTVDFFKANL